MKVLALGGSILFGDLEANKISEFADVIDEFDGKLVIVVGGGKIARKYIEIARDLGANETLCDIIGIDVTRVNARVFSASLRDASSKIPHSPEEVEILLKTCKKVVMGGTFPGHTTDATAAIVAEFVGAEELLIATSVDGVYSSDPNRNPQAQRYERLTSSELVEIVSRSEINAGSSSVVDLLAAKIIQRSRINARVFLGTPENLRKALKGEKIGTEIIP
ncbi:UMP kinase [Geoglobus acetivorans]|uniref:Uridylate kinase n=1 Tax=Geoglobus acetivorans TaxID=565033 RepID=A0ABZ3H3D9_GEOAI|nr:UMP kinase [Geoglobus acetivorans]